MRTRLCDMFGIDLPIFAFSHCRDVVAAVSRAGGLGVLGALAFSPEQLEIELNWIDEHVDGKPYGVDVVMPAKVASAEGAANPIDPAAFASMIPQAHRDWLDKVLAEYGVPPLAEEERSGEGALLGWVHEKGRLQVDIALQHPISLLVNALGPPPKDIVDLAHEHDVKVAALTGKRQHAERQVQQGVDIIVAQGSEAGGHTGEVASIVLWPEVVEAVAPTPVLAAGGIGHGAQIAAALAMGCEGVWTGSIWLTTAESDSSPGVIEKLLAADSSGTRRSRSWTGKPARMLKTDWTEIWERDDSPGYLPMPLQYMLINEAQRRIAKYQVKALTTMPVGQIVGRMNEVRPVRDVMFQLVEEFIEASERLTGLVAASS